MNKAEILLAYKAGKLTTAEAQEKLRELKEHSLKGPLSEGQRGLWMLQKMSSDMSAYNIPICFRIARKLDIGKFQRASRFVLEQYPILTTIIGEDNGVPYQAIQPSQSLSFQSEDISNLDSKEVLPYLREKIKVPFSLQQGPLMRVHVLSRSEQEHIVLITIHHIIFDGGSLAPFITTLFDAYQELIEDRNPVIIPSSTSYNDFVKWEREMLASNEGEAHRSYWKQQLSGTLPLLQLPTDYPRSATPSFKGQVYSKLLSPELSDSIKVFAASLNMNLSVVFLGIFKVLLHRYTNQDDIIVGLPTIGRPQEHFSSLIGYFINMIPIRSQVTKKKSFLEFVRELQLTVVDGLDHAVYPFPTLVRTLNVPRTPGNSPVFQVIFLYQNYLQSTNMQHLQDTNSNTLPVESVQGIHQEGEYELELEVYEQGDTFALNLKYNPDLFAEATIHRMMGHYLNLTQEIMNNPNLTVDEYSLLSQEEEKKILIDWNATKNDYPKDKCVHELFEQQVQKTPDAIAVICEEEILTYRELDEKSTWLAIYLQRQGIHPDCLVGICVERHCRMIVGLLGILKAGGAYVPLDPGYPSERLEYMIHNSKVSLLLTQSGLMAKIARLIGNNLKVVSLDNDWAEIEQVAKAGQSLKRGVHPNHLAYVIYTSGSTGKPKGVMIPHQALTNFLISMSQNPGLNSQDKLLAVTTYCFDIAGLEIYLPLINGAKVYICSSKKAKDVEKLKQEIQKYQPTIMQATPVTWTMLFQAGWKNEAKMKILCGGEALSETLKQYFMDTNCELWNMFGPTETTIWSTVEYISEEEPITVGKPIANTQVYILDRNLTPTPIGIPGELCIAGDGLARGYLNQPELTGERFIDNPFQLGTKLYKTGDLARWSADGKIEFCGRMDTQVKIRGFRIELGEIESQLKAHPEIQDCAVIVKEQADHKQLVAFYVAKKPLVQPQLRAYLKSKVPEYMIPALLIEIDKMPLTPNGKLDRKVLMNRTVVKDITEDSGDKPYLEIEAKVLRIWKDILNTNNIGLEDGFFDVGGDSFLAVTVAQRIKKCFDCEFNVTELFQYTNIKEISNYIIKTKDDILAAQSASPQNFGTEIADSKEIINREALHRTPYPNYYQDSLAIIGISCHFPGAKNHFEFWQNLREGKESVKFFSKEELLKLNLPKEIIENPNFIPIQVTVAEKDLFDSSFFNISPRDAEYMDPQFRLLLMHSWKALEDAGYIPKQIPETSVFMSASNNLYQALLSNINMSPTETTDNSGQYVSWILAQGGTIPTMISHKLGFKGPSFFVHSNCSSSLVGLNLAYQSLCSREAKYALVGAASISPLSNVGYMYETGLISSSDGHVKTFDASADGMIGGEGVAVIVLKKALNAIEDGDHIYALLRGIGVNNDGADKVGFYAPSVKGQAEVIQKVLDSTQIHPESIHYIEAHGTGTKLGDPVELAALNNIYQQYTTKKQFCGIGSVKTNIGHLDTAAGLAGCIKVALSLYHHEIPPSLNYKEPNPNIDFKNSPFYVVDKLLKWEDNSVPHRAALSSFGIGGTNTHAIFEQHLATQESEPIDFELNNNSSYIIPLSAKNDERLKAYAQEFLDFLSTNAFPSNTNQPDHIGDLKHKMKKDIVDYLSTIIHINQEQINSEPDFSELNIDYVQLDGIMQFFEAKWEIEMNPQIVTQPKSIDDLITRFIESHSTDLNRYYQTINESSIEPIVQSGFNLARLAYTLQVGREAMASRVVFIISHPSELIHQLEEFIRGNEKIAGCFTGKINQLRDKTQLFEKEEDSQEIIQKWLAKGQGKKLAELWINGFQIDWDLLYPGPKPRRISLPTYPFAEERYGLPKIDIKSSIMKDSAGVTFIHPLLHQNTSDFLEQRFTSTFTGKEFFLADRVVKSQPVLPEVACLEMVRAAVEQAVGLLATAQTGIRLTNIVWTRPIAIGIKPIQVHIGLFPEENGEIAYEIYTLPNEGNVPQEWNEAGTDDAGPIVHSQGSAVLIPVATVPDTDASRTDARSIDLKTLQAKCSQRTLSSAELYASFKMMEIEYGSGYQGVEVVYIGQDQILAKLSLPSVVANTQAQFDLHPSMMDSALQASIGFMMNSGMRMPLFPDALQELEVLGSCTAIMWALIRKSGNEINDESTWKLDIDVCDETGTVCVRMKGLEMHEATNFQIAPMVDMQEADELMTFEEVWQEEALPEAGPYSASPIKPNTLVCFLSNPENQQVFIETIQTHEQQTQACAPLIFVSQSTAYPKQTREKYVIVRTDRNSYMEAFRSIREDTLEYYNGEIDTILYLWPLEDPSFIQDYSCIVHILQALVSTKLKVKRILFAAQFDNGLDRCYLESWIGFERSLGLVLPNTEVAAIYQAAHGLNRESLQEWARKLWAELQTQKIKSVLYQDGKRYVCQIRPTTITSGNPPLKPGGTYLITGGCGGLGLLFAEHLAKQSSATGALNLILTGRSSLDAGKQSKIKAIEDLGSRVIYMQADLSNSTRMKKGLNQAKEHFGAIHGVIHAAGIAGNQSIFAKEIQSFQKVLDPKIKGTLVLDELLKAEPLDFICYFSSTAAVLGDFGSCDYAIANRFLMAYARYRNQQLNGERPGQAIVINWPLWKDGGMGSGDNETSRMYLKSSGQRILETSEGLAVFDRILAQNNNTQHLVFIGQPNRVHRFLGLTQEQPTVASLAASGSSHNAYIHAIAHPYARGRRPEMKGLNMEQCLEWDLKEQISQLLKISRAKLDREENLADFGFDSMSLAQLANLLSSYYGIAVTPAIFFGYSTIEKLIQYFLTEHQEVIQEFYRGDVRIAQVNSPKVPALSTALKLRPQRFRFAMGSVASNIAEPIAIIGMSGRVPGARNIDELWKILVAGEDMIGEIPPERFDWRQYYGDPGKDPDKINCKWCGCIPGVSEFEPLFFEISPKEAETMDPRQRLLLQESWKALEDAGYGTEQIKTKKIGMFVGAEQGDYQFLVKEAGGITSNNNAILAARLAYFLNLNGPVMAIDTACSSGLVAAHQAILSLRAGECDTAIAAGVNLLLTPIPYIGMSRAGMLSEDGKCYAFDKRADGMVPGEAVAVIVFKRLSQAEADGDPIYAVIKASGINYDGKTNGITAPNGVSQTNLLKAVYDQYRINPEDIGYIVTHGTGTRLGDPVEINALYDAFKDYTRKQNYCALTSTKTNFGHTFAASGLVSLISLVQAIRHETIPASLHCEQENDYINWQESPFYVNKTNQPWPIAVSDGAVTHRMGAGITRTGAGITRTGAGITRTGAGITRTGAVSAFGMSGTNAHMVVQSYSREEEVTGRGVLQDQVPCYLLVFSAKTGESLAEKVKDMIEVLQNKDIQTQDLIQISYTLLDGRQHFNHRCAIVIQDREDAVYVLKQVTGKEKLPNLFQGKVPRDFKGQKVIEQYAQDLLNMSRTAREIGDKYQEILYALADLYCQGYELDWKQLYGNVKPYRIHLPTYPFARECYWAAENITSSSVMATSASLHTLHPLLHQNTSNLSEQRFSSTFTGREFFLADHGVKGRRVLPGVALLEMARAAVESATSSVAPNAIEAGSLTEGQTGIRLKNIVWARPIMVEDQPVQIHIGLFPKENGEIAYEIYSSPHSGRASEEAGAEPVIHSQGKAVLNSTIEIPSLDLNALQALCGQNTLSSAKVYETFKAMGFEYGPGLQGIEQVYPGQGQILVKLSLPVSVLDTKDQYILHPSMLDSALQASLGFMIETGDLKPVTPVTLQELEIFGKCGSIMWALIQYGNDNKVGDTVPTSAPTRKLDIDLCDEQGIVRVRMKGYSARVLEGEAGLARSPVIGTLMLKPGWKEETITLQATVPDYAQHLVIFCEMGDFHAPEPILESAETGLNGVRFLSLQSKQKGIDKRFQTYTNQVFEEIQNLLQNKLKGKVLIQLVVPNQGEQQLCSGISGLLKTAWLENPKLIGQLIEVDPTEDSEGIVSKLKENSRCPNDNHIRYQAGQRWIAGWSEVKAYSEGTSFAEEDIPWKADGIYLITGGAGGLGLIFAQDIARKAKSATLILTGRSLLNEEKSSARAAQISELEATGVRISYRQVDVTDKKAVTSLIQSIREEFGGLQGIIHSAGVIKDNFIIKKTQDELFEVLAPKVSGIVNLDGASKDLPLDFFIFFSSMSGSLGNPGQADYSAANAFEDAYASYRNQLVASGRRFGRTLSINWPLWQAGGMHVDAETEKIMLQNTGMIALRTQTGIRALYRALASGQDQVLVMEGELSKLREYLLKPASKVQFQPVKTMIPTVDPEQFREKTIHQLKGLLGEITKLPIAKIDIEEPLERYGIDSLMIIQLNQKLAGICGDLSKTLFYEYQTLGALAGYLMIEYPQECMKWTGLIGSNTDAVQSIPAAVVYYDDQIPVLTSHAQGKASNKRTRNFSLMASGNESREPIAIIGMSGRYPRARTLQEYWRNLAAGKDSITEIPEERWPLQGFYQPDPMEAMAQGKSYCKWGGFIEGFADFDPLFFNISPREAFNMDPQERLFIQSCWEVFEDAGYTRAQLTEQYQGRVGVFAGITKTGFSLYGPGLWKQGEQISPNTSFSSVANRVSYLLNLQGPSMPVDTMCSSSLTAIHEACEHLLRSECALAIAGGVNLYLHPSSYTGLCSQQMLSVDGQCKSFGQGGNGFVPGEGVGVVLLKPLSRAIADQDHIYAVIRGTGINHGGKTNGYTVPNPNAQGELIRLTLEKAGVDARTVSYIEAHGTGTELGDPIEITGLTQAFRRACSRAQDTEDTGYCAIGSVKSNIGHLEAAAGIAGLTKIIMQMKYGQLVPSLHAKELNPNINFAKTPFIVQQELMEWKRPVIDNNGVIREYPRIAGISSFGAGGANAHVVLEEYIPGETQKRPMIMNIQNPVVPATQEGAMSQHAVLQSAIIVLSAKNEDRLREQARRLLAMIKEQPFSDGDLADSYLADSYLADIAYTLQVGREAMEERLGMVVGSIKELEEKLNGFIAGQDSPADIYRGQAKGNKEAVNAFNTDEELQEAVNKWIGRKKHGKLLDFWVKGLIFDWNKLYGESKPRRISLPTYPFAGESYWIPERYWGRELEAGARARAISGSMTPAMTTLTSLQALHPLLHQNTSDIAEQRFTSTFTGEEFFLTDHVIKGQRVLPGVVYLEMARAAVTQAIASLGEVPTGIRLKNVVWARPVVVGEQPVRIHIGLYPQDSACFQGGIFGEGDGEIAYEIYSLPYESGTFEKDDREPVVYSQGSATLSSITEPPTVDLKDILSRCDHSTVSAAEIYQAYQAMGINYGPGHQGIETVYVGPGQVLAKLSLPFSVLNSQDQFMLHPSIMDSALQASLGFMIGAGDGITPLKPALPFALQELEVFGKCTSIMWALIRFSEASSKEHVTLNGRTGKDIDTNNLQKLDIDICDEQGTICIRMKGYSSRVLKSEEDSIGTSATIGSLMLEPVWKEQKIVPEIPVPDYTQQWVILCELNEVSPESIETQMNGVHCVSFQSKRRGIDKKFQAYAGELFGTIRNTLNDKNTGKILIQVVVSSQDEQQLFTGLLGLLKTAQLENPKLTGQIIEIDPSEDAEGIIAKLQENARVGAGRYPLESQIRYQSGKRMVAGWSEGEAFPEETSAATNIPWKDRGIYLITGGAGSLGLILADEIAHQVKESTLILTGRSLLDQNQQTRLHELKLTGTKVIYRQVDVTDKKAVTGLFQSIEEEFGSLHGIIHSAGVIKDNFIIKKTHNEFFEVLAPKVTGLVNLDEASKDLSLDFFVLFASTSGSMGNPGQADYSTANAFMNAYARYRNRLVALKSRYGRTLSINWPLWQEGGMHVDAETEKLLLLNSGLVPMPTSTGIQALYRAIASGKDELMVLAGNLKQLRTVFLAQPPPTKIEKISAGDENKAVPIISAGTLSEDLLQEKAANYLKEILASAIKLPAHRIEADAPLEKYGIDSIMVMQLTNQLEKTFGSLSKTLFFEYQTIRELTGYFLESYRNQLTATLGIEAQDTSSKTAATSEIDSVAIPKPVASVINSRRHPRFAFLRTPSPEEKTTGALDIAIIGVSGRYPGARNIQEFWQNLRDGRDCITEIPKDRWDHSLYFDEDKNKPGKTYSKWGGFLEGVDQFDPLFFNISPREAEFMDPQERLFLECVYETLEDAGYTRNLGQHQGFGGNVGVYVGVMYEEYQLYGAQEQIQGRPIALSGNPSSIANRVSYFCNFHGPSIAVDTMCSSSLTAIHLACQSLQRGGCEFAIAGGVNVSIHPNKYLMLAQGRFVSSKGRCESFGEGGDGYVPGEGVGAVLLKPLAKAIADGDHIYGVIRGTAINHGGKTNGYSIPNPNAQAWAIGQALKEARIDPRTISYIEAHGTGTSLGDPIEITGLTKAFREYTKDNQFCAIGSAKSNIGHCESAAGIAGVTKVLLQLKSCQLAPSLHSEVLNPNIDFGNSPFVVQQTLAEWKRPVVNGLELPRRAGISSFGAGGSNAHVVIEEYILKEMDQPLIIMNSQNTAAPVAQKRAVLQRAVLQHAIIVLSAKNEERLREQARRLLTAINERKFTDTELDSIAYTLQVGREAMEERLGMVVGSLKELDEKLRGFIEGQDSPGDIYRGQIKGNKETLNVFTADEEMREAVDKWIQRGKYARLLELWVKGLIFDWNKLYGNIKPRRISLPAYPFAGESYWFTERYGSTKPSRVLEQENQTGNLPQKVSLDNSRALGKETPAETVMLTPIWDVVPVANGQRSPSPIDQMVIVGGTKDHHDVLRQLYPEAQLLEIKSKDTIDSMVKMLEAQGAINHILWIAPYRPLQSMTDNVLIEKQNQGVLQVFRIIKALLSLGYGNKNLGFDLITIQTQFIRKDEAVNPTHASLYGLAGSLAKEYPNWKLRVIDLEAGASGGTDWPIDDILNLPPDPGGNPFVYRDRKWHRQQLIPIHHVRTRAHSLNRTLYRTKGIYVVIGGAGGIGEAWSEYMINTYQAQVIWIGRRPKDAAIQAKLDKLANPGPAPDYITADATDRKALQQAYETIKERYSQIHGVIHSAIVLLDRSIQNMEEERFQAGLTAKVDVSVRLAQVFHKESLDFVLFFSSLQSFSKAPGQSNYAAGCTFKDAFAHQLGLEWPCPVKVMNWGYWGNVGVVASKAYREKMAKAGIGSIEPVEAMEALETLLAGPLDQIAFIKTMSQRVMEEINIEELIAVYSENPALNVQNIQNHIPASLLKQVLKASRSIKDHDSNRLLMYDKVQAVLLKMAAQLLKVNSKDIDIDAEFSEYGFEPLALTEFVNRLNREYPLELTSVLFLEYPTLHRFAEYLVETYQDVFIKRFQSEAVVKQDSSIQYTNRKGEIGQ